MNATATDGPLSHPRPRSEQSAADTGPSAADVRASAAALERRSRRRRHATLVAQARHGRVRLYHHRGAKPYRRLGSLPHSYGSPPVFLATRQRGRWLRVELPIRPNHSTAWIRQQDVTVFATDYRIAIDLPDHRLRLRRGGNTVLNAPIAVGKALTPTPAGRYFVAYTIRTDDPNGFFGPYALGLSAYSHVLTSFAGGDGEVGIHGTSTPDGPGSNVSHGCIRVSNAVVTRLARTVPPGTPVTVKAR